MKRILITAAAVAASTAAFALPSSASAQDVDIYINPQAGVICPDPLVDCAERLANWAVDTTFATVRRVPVIVGDACDIVFGPGSCGLLAE